jgi:ATP-binding cassette, subfamily B, bacterial PglK
MGQKQRVAGVIDDWQRLRNLVGPRSWSKFVRTYLLGAVAALLETASIAAVFPLVAGIVNAQNGAAAPWFAAGPGVVLLGLLYVMGLGLRALAVHQSAKTNLSEGYGFSARLFQQSLDQPYAWNFFNHSADLRAAILTDAQDLISAIFVPLGRLISQVTLVVAVSCVLLVMQPVATLIFGSVIILTYVVIFAVLRRPLKQDAERQIMAHRRRHRLTAEAYSASREVRLSHLEGRFTQEFAAACDQLAQAGTNRSVYVELPKLALEAVIFSLLAWFVVASATSAEMLVPGKLPTFALFAAAGLKLFPMGHQVFANLALLRGGWPLVSKLELLLRGFQVQAADVPCPPMTTSLSLENVGFHYPGNAWPAVSNISFVARPGQKVAITGPSGSGKSTLIDVIAGLIHPSEGQILIDGSPQLPAHSRGWQKQLRYCPQMPSLFDLSITDNITLGVEYPREQLQAAVHLACLDEMIAGKASALDAVVGEQGRNLSGGQIKRISIARAFLDDVAVYILDEPTSNLDPATAQQVITRIFAARPNAIIFVVTHDQALARQCDLIVDLSALAAITGA